MNSIKALALDIDGVLTDGCVWWGPGGEEWRRFSFRDIMAVSLACKSGLRVALITGESPPQADQFAKKFGLEHVYKGCKDKTVALRNFADSCGFALEELAFMGDDINDVPAMELCGLPAAPADAHDAAKAVARLVTTHKGGRGAVRELVDHLLPSHLGRSRSYP
ncbi:MAG: HAD hydrolase family protein [Planctomycetota bacterium]